MSERKVKIVDGEIYHIYNRGNSKNVIFHDVQDCDRFMKMLYVCNSTKKFKTKDFVKINKDLFSFERGENLVQVMCFVLMPNHFHLLLTSDPANRRRTDNNLDNNISVFIKRLTVAYSKYYNFKYNRTGGLFEGKFKAEHVTENTYFRYLFSYIHLNPVKLIQSNWKEVGLSDHKRANDYLDQYEYSSFKDYFNSPRKARGYEKIVSTNAFLSRIDEGVDLNKEIFDWLKFKTININ